MDTDAALEYLQSQHSVIRFYRDEEIGEDVVRVVIEDPTQERRTVIKRTTKHGVVEAFTDAVAAARVEYEASERRSRMRAI